MPAKNIVTLSRPKNKSLKAFKEWIMSLTSTMTGKPEKDDMAKEEWTKCWKEFWGKADKGATK
jgi:hypothetical protein